MEFIVSHSKELLHRCNLPRKFLDHVLGEGHQFDIGQLLVVCITDTTNNQSSFLAMNQFIDAPVVELPVDYLPFADQVILTYIKEPVIGKRIVLKPYTSEFAKLDAPEEALENFIKKEFPCINKNVDFFVNGTKIKIEDVLDTEEKSIDYTVAFNHNIEVDVLEPLIQTPPPTHHSSPKPETDSIIEKEHSNGILLGGRKLSREEWLKKYEK